MRYELEFHLWNGFDIIYREADNQAAALIEFKQYRNYDNDVYKIVIRCYNA